MSTLRQQREVPMSAEESSVRRRRGPSMADVARLAGVSGQTVSRVANDRHNVDAATRDRVLAVMREVGYRPNSAARALRNGQFRSIGVIVFELSSFGNTRTLDAIATAATTSGYAVNLLPVLDATQGQGARLATEHLLDLGHETVWHLGGPLSSFAASRRRRSWRQTLTDRGRAVLPVLVGDWSPGSGYDAGRRLAADADVTAVFAANDQMALGLVRALHEAGRTVPDDVSVVGFDDMEEAAYFWPPLTTVRQSFAEVGRRSVDALISEIRAGEHHHQPVSVATELVIRDSTAPPRRTTA